MKAVDSGRPIEVPVDGNTGARDERAGKPVDQLGPVVSDKHYRFTGQRRHWTNIHLARNVRDGNQGVDLIEPYLKGGKIGLFVARRR